MQSGDSSLVAFGASVPGPRHRVLSRRNEDAWTARRWNYASMAVVADGMGSRPFARAGSQAACAAAVGAARWALRVRETSPAAISAELEDRWLKSISEICEPSQAATTCLWVLGRLEGPLLMGQVGDGMVAVRGPDGTVEFLAKRDGFTNETDALGLSGDVHWHSLYRPTLEPGTAVLLATDGVSDDLDPERIGEFIEMLTMDFAPLAPHERWAALRRELAHWPTPHHLDDKTLVVLWTAA